MPRSGRRSKSPKHRIRGGVDTATPAAPVASAPPAGAAVSNPYGYYAYPYGYGYYNPLYNQAYAAPYSYSYWRPSSYRSPRRRSPARGRRSPARSPHRSPGYYDSYSMRTIYDGDSYTRSIYGGAKRKSPKRKSPKRRSPKRH